MAITEEYLSVGMSWSVELKNSMNGMIVGKTKTG